MENRTFYLKTNKFFHIVHLRSRDHNFQKVDCPSIHLQSCMLKRSHAYLFQFQILILSEKIEEKSVLHCIFLKYYHQNRWESFQNRHISKSNQAAYPHRGKSSIFAWHVWLSILVSYGARHSLYFLNQFCFPHSNLQYSFRFRKDWNSHFLIWIK